MATQHSKETKGKERDTEKMGKKTQTSGSELEVKTPAQTATQQQPSGALQSMRNPASALMERIRRRGSPSPTNIWAATPFELMRRMADDIDRMFEGVPLMALADDFFGGLPSERSMWSPRIDVFERGNDLVVRADLPGIKKEDLNIEVVGNNLVVSGERKYEHEEQRDGYYRSEREYGTFRRAIPLPEGANPDDAKATFDGGVLEVTVKKAERQSRRIEIGSGEEVVETKATAGDEPQRPSDVH